MKDQILTYLILGTLAAAAGYWAWLNVRWAMWAGPRSTELRYLSRACAGAFLALMFIATMMPVSDARNRAWWVCLAVLGLAAVLGVAALLARRSEHLIRERAAFLRGEPVLPWRWPAGLAAVLVFAASAATSYLAGESLKALTVRTSALTPAESATAAAIESVVVAVCFTLMLIVSPVVFFTQRARIARAAAALDAHHAAFERRLQLERTGQRLEDDLPTGAVVRPGGAIRRW